MSQLPIEELEEIANREIGEVLRLTRIHYGKTLMDVEEDLRIRSCQISAIERGDVKQLPGRVYAIGFVRSYAEYLGIDGEKTVDLFKAQYMDGGHASNKPLPFHVSTTEARTPAVWLVALSVLISLLFFISWGSYNKSEQNTGLYIENIPQDMISHMEEEIFATPPVIEDTVIIKDVAVENMSNNEPQKTGIILNIIDNSWVEIKNADGDIILSNILEKGELYFAPDSPGLTMSLGNAANIEIIIDGQALKPLGKDGDVRRDIPLNTTYLKTLEFK